jgi:hypothetical protein
MYDLRENGVHPKDSPHQSIAHIRLGGKDYRLKYDWAAIEKVQTMFLGTQDLNKPRDLSEIIAIGLEIFHPGVLTADEIMKFSEPLVPTADRVATALAYGLGTHPALSQPEKSEANPQKPNRNARRVSAAHTKRHSESGSELANSGP